MQKEEAGSFGESPYRRPMGSPPNGGGGFRQSWSRTLAEVGLVLLLLALALFGIRGCAGCTASVIVSQLPPSVDAAIGKAAGEATRQQHAMSGKEPTPEQTERVRRVFDELRAGLTPEETKILVDPRVTTVVDDQVNAFALPGGEVFVLTGLLDRVKDDDDLLRGVLAHELGHAVHRHGVRSIARNGVYGMVLSFILGDLNGIAATVVAGASQLDTLQYSRSME